MLAPRFTWWTSLLCVSTAACADHRPEEEVRTCGAGTFGAAAEQVVGGLVSTTDGAAVDWAVRFGEAEPGSSRCVHVNVQIFSYIDASMVGAGTAWVRVNRVNGEWQTAPLRVQFTRPVDELVDQNVEVRVQTLGELGGTQTWVDQRLGAARDDETLTKVSEDCSDLLESRPLTLLDGEGEYTAGRHVESVIGFQGSQMITPAVQLQRQSGDPDPVCTALRLMGSSTHPDRRTHRHIITGPYELSGSGAEMRGDSLFYEVYELDSGQTLDLEALLMGEGWRAQRSVSIQVTH